MDLNRTFAQAVTHQNEGRWAEAEALYRRIDKARPGMAAVTWNLGVVLKAQEKWEPALATFERTAKADPSFRGVNFNIGLCLQKLGRMADATTAFEKSVEVEPDDAVGRFNLASAYRDQNKVEVALEQVTSALALKPDFVEAQLLQSKLRTQMLPLWHVPMVNDAPRNDAYEAAIKAQVRPGDLVLEIGTGSGLLAMMAAQAGAQVVTCEAVPWIAETARAVIAANGLSDRITVVNTLSTALQVGDVLPRRADVLLSEIVASDFLSERIIPAVADARARLLVPDARILPARGGVRCALAGGDVLEKHLFTGPTSGFDLSAFNHLYPRSVRYDARLVQPVALSAPVDPFSFDFTGEPIPGSEHVRFTLPAGTDGRCVALAQWVWLDFGGGVTFENSPFIDSPASGWQPGFYLPDRPLTVTRGQVLAFDALHDGYNVWLSFRP
ncbi:tetratricopeptide repeat protein [Niveispirillum sp.]|uniref:tetratricopeptide repeat protein n=1 Tax=Niveispirillum sp. TaxID=1917217 RepID=UPI001B41654A|nr:tetratricopeptide repeat protein [Niveispirillum sp.]MBP7335746.1 tetratricopeptide repeat protein [Niveispirillum sp.]